MVVCAIAAVLAALTVPLSASAAEFHDGGAVSNPHVYPIFWGKSWSTKNATVRSELMSMYEQASGSAWLGILTQYYGGEDVVTPTITLPSPAFYTDESVENPTNVTHGSIQDEVTKAIEANKSNGWPQKPTGNDQFVVLLPPRTEYYKQSEFLEECAYHSHYFKGFEGKTYGTSYSAIPYPGGAPTNWEVNNWLERSCVFEGASHANDMSVYASHELAESIVGWNKGTNESEVADICTYTSNGFQLPGGAWVQKLWDQHQQTCSSADANPPQLHGVTLRVSDITPNRATFVGRVNPGEQEAKYRFEWGDEEGVNDLGKYKIYSGSTEWSGIGNGTSDIPVSVRVSGLTPGATYFMRVAVAGTVGETHGRPATFVPGPAQSPGALTAFGTTGTANGQFKHPADIAVTPKGTLWVLDQEDNRVENFNKAGEYLSQFGSKGTGNGQFQTPDALTIDPKGNIWVTDTWNQRVQEFNEKGEFIRKFGTFGTGNGQFFVAEGIAADSKGNVWVSDANGRVQKFNETGEFIKSISATGSPEGIAIGPGNNLFVTEWNNDRVEEFNEAGEFVRRFGTEGSGNGQLDRPDAVSVDSEGDVWVADRGNNRVEEFTETGEYLGQFGTKGSGLGQFEFSFPVGLVADSKDNIWVTDPGANRVERWAY